MKIRIITEREVDPRDLGVWLRIYRDHHGYRIDPEKLLIEKTASWSDDHPKLRTRATTTITIVDGEA